MFSFASVPFSPPEDEEVQQRKPRYPGEDTTPTRKKEILGWYIYGVAAEVFAVSGVGKSPVTGCPWSTVIPRRWTDFY